MRCKIVENETFIEKSSKVPKVLPNNIRLICERFKLSDIELAEKLGVRPNYINLVKNQNANLSGKTTIKLMIELNIPFNLIYNVNKEVDVLYEDSYESYMILKTDTRIDLKTENSEELAEIADFITNYFNEVVGYDENTDIYIQKYIDNIVTGTDDNGKCTFSLNCQESNLNITLMKKYKDIVSNLELTEGNYIFIGYELKKITRNSKEFINLQANLNLDLLGYINDVPFVAEKEVSIDNFYEVYDNEKVHLDKEYVFYKDGKFVVGNEIEDKYIELSERNNKHFIKFKVYSFIKLKAVRLKLGLSIQEMADILEVENGTYVLIESGLQRISTQLMWIIEKNLGITIDSIIDIKKYYEFFYNSTCDESEILV